MNNKIVLKNKIPAGSPGIPLIGRERRPRAPRHRRTAQRKSLIFEAGVGDRLATLRVSRAYEVAVSKG